MHSRRALNSSYTSSPVFKLIFCLRLLAWLEMTFLQGNFSHLHPTKVYGAEGVSYLLSQLLWIKGKNHWHPPPPPQHKAPFTVGTTKWGNGWLQARPGLTIVTVPSPLRTLLSDLCTSLPGHFQLSSVHQHRPPLGEAETLGSLSWLSVG